MKSTLLSMPQWIIFFLLTLCLSSCGGGKNGEGSETAPSSSSMHRNTYTNKPAAQGGTAEKVSLLNREGSRGNAYIGSHANSSTFEELFIKESGNAFYTYRSTPEVVGSIEAWVDQLNSEGRDGFLLKSPTLPNAGGIQENLFLKGQRYYGQNDTYIYKVVAGSFSLTELNLQGALGYSYRGQRSGGDRGDFMFFVKNQGNPSNQAFEQSHPTKYSYKTKPALNDVSSLLDEMNTLGKEDYVYFSSLSTDQGTVSLYERSNNNNYFTEFLSMPSQLDTTAPILIEKANQQAANGYEYWGELNLSNGTQVISLFYKGLGPSTHPTYGPTFP
jgi:hypothetical protein